MSNVRVLATDLEFPEGPVVMPDGSVVEGKQRGALKTRRASRDRVIRTPSAMPPKSCGSQ